MLLNLRGEPRSTAPITTAAGSKPAAQAVNSATMTKKPAGATVVKPDAAADKEEETASATPAAKPATATKKKATTAKPAAAKSEPADEPKREPRPPKVNCTHSFACFHVFLLLAARASSSCLYNETYKHIHTCVF